MSKSLEALERIGEAYSGIYNCCSDIQTDYEKEYNTIKQDLEAYEQLKQDHDITLINNGELVVKVADLQKENKELLVNKNFAQGVALKYKKAIEKEIEILIERRSNAYYTEEDEVYRELDIIIEELREVLENE